MLLKWSPRARKDLRKLWERDARRVVEAMDDYFETHYGNVKKLRGFDPPRYRLRVGTYRAIFRREGDTLLVLRVRHRRDAY